MGSAVRVEVRVRVTVRVEVRVRVGVMVRTKVRVCLVRRIPHYDLTAQCTAPCAKRNGRVSVRVKVRICLGLGLGCAWIFVNFGGFS